MSKRPITFNRPEDPSFLKKIKESIGYKEGPTVDTKRQKPEDFGSDDEEREAELDYKPQVVVLRAGDLTEEEADREKQRLEREEEEKPADLSQRVVFKKPTKAVNEAEAAEDDKDQKRSTTGDKNQKKGGPSSSKGKSAKPAPKLSFDQDDDEEEETF